MNHHTKAHKEKIAKGLSDALGFAKGARGGARITVTTACEFYIGGVRFDAGRYQIKKLPDLDTVSEIGARASF